MLNADGGVLVFGISNDGELQNVSTLPNIEEYRKVTFDYITPPCNIELEEVEIDGNLIFIPC